PYPATTATASPMAIVQSTRRPRGVPRRPYLSSRRSCKVVTSLRCRRLRCLYRLGAPARNEDTMHFWGVTPTPSPTPTLDPDLVTPGPWGFLVIALLAAAVV